MSGRQGGARRAKAYDPQPSTSDQTESTSLGGLTETDVSRKRGLLDIRAQTALLRRAFDNREIDRSASDDSILSPEQRALISQWGWRIAKIAAGLAILGLAGVGPIQRLFELSSVDAVVNARLVSLRAPFDGTVETIAGFPTIGARAQAGGPVLRISNIRADRSRIDDLARIIDQIDGERTAIQGRLTRLRELHGSVLRQADAFQAGRIQELEARSLDLKAQVAGAEAMRVEAESTLERVKSLAASGAQSKAALERAQRDAAFATETARALDHRLTAVGVELTAARRGEYVGDTYNDRPSSRQQADELSIRIAESEAELKSRDQRLDKLRDQLAAERDRHESLSNVLLRAPIEGRVWEVLVSPGEEVRRGQDLVRLLDCSGTVITSTVRESVFNRLQIGDEAQFSFTDQSGTYKGYIIRMSGMAAPPDNLAIQSSSPASGAYRITVAAPDLAVAKCGIGRTGRVVFEPNSAASGKMHGTREGLPGS
jgi:biotin carboxyl carrier protein